MLAGAALGAAMALPLVYLLITVADSAGDALEIVTTSRTLELTARSVGLAAAVTAGAIAIAVPLAWLTARTDLPGRRAWSVLAALPLVIPSYMGAYAVLSALGPAGLLRDVLGGPLGVERLPDITGFPGAWLVLTLFTYPLVFLPVRAALRGLDPQLEEAALGMGRSQWQTLRTVVLPQLAPAIAAGGILVALYALHDFGAVSIMRFDSFTREIFTAYRASFDRTGAAALSLILVALMVVLVWLEFRARGGATLHRSGPGGTRPARLVPLGRWRLPSLAFCALICGLALALPIAVLGYWSLQSFSGDPNWGETVEAAGSSLLVSGFAALAAAACAVPIAVLSVRFPSRGSRLVERLTYTGYALPGIVVALAMVFLATRSVPALYQTLALLLAVYAIRFAAQPVGGLRAALAASPPAMEEAGRVLGDGPLRAFVRVTLPYLRPSLVAGVALVFLTVIKELPLALLLSPIGFQTLATDVWDAASAGFYARAAAPAAVLLLVSIVSVGALQRAEAGEW